VPAPPVTVLPPYALDAPAFPFRALAALAGRAQLGGERETVLGCLMGARLAEGMLPPYSLSASVRATRAAGARAWLSSLALPAGMRTPLAKLMDATGGEDRRAVAVALGRVADAASGPLDAAARQELERLAQRLTG
jgi:hypothetical protein